MCPKASVASMAQMIVRSNLAEAWLSALEYLLAQGGETVNLAVVITKPTEEDPRIRAVLDQFIESQRRTENKQGLERISTVANTLFPKALYRPQLGDSARKHLFDMEKRGRDIARRRNRTGTYFERLVAWPDSREEFNQLDHVITRLVSARKRGQRKGNAYEFGVTTQEDVISTADLSLRIYSPGIDNRIMGFPCLSHITLSLMGGRLHMSALYRNHHYVRRSYGNYLGLGHLLMFICRESGWEPGELLCVSSHADAEIASFGKSRVTQLVLQCRAAVC
jgi:hypothetical protein